MSKRYDICTPRPGRDDKTFWHRIGTAWEGDKGIQLVFDSLPLPDRDGRFVANLFEPREKQQDNRSGARDRRDAQARGGSQPNYRDDDDDSGVPF